MHHHHTWQPTVSPILPLDGGASDQVNNKRGGSRSLRDHQDASQDLYASSSQLLLAVEVLARNTRAPYLFDVALDIGSDVFECFIELEKLHRGNGFPCLLGLFFDLTEFSVRGRLIKLATEWVLGIDEGIKLGLSPADKMSPDEFQVDSAGAYL